MCSLGKAASSPAVSVGRITQSSFGTRRLSSVGQSDALVMRRSGVRFPEAAPQELRRCIVLGARCVCGLSCEENRIDPLGDRKFRNNVAVSAERERDLRMTEDRHRYSCGGPVHDPFSGKLRMAAVAVTRRRLRRRKERSGGDARPSIPRDRTFVALGARPHSRWKQRQQASTIRGTLSRRTPRRSSRRSASRQDDT
jgi:hypothetical protein